MIVDYRNFASRTFIMVVSMLGALNDNLIKAALIVFAAMTVPSDQAAIVGLLAGALLMLPFVLFSGVAGALADKCEKSRMILWVKVAELGLAAFATMAMVQQSVPLVLSVVFLMGVQSTFFGPLKLGWIPERLYPGQVLAANSWLESLTFVGILAGTIMGGLLAGPQTLAWAGYTAIGVASLGVIAAHFLPKGRAAAPDINISLNPARGAMDALRALWADAPSRNAAFLESWFWAAGSVYISTLPSHLKSLAGADEKLVTAILALFCVGIAAGSLVAARASKGKINGRLLLPSGIALIIATFGVDYGLSHLPSDVSLTAIGKSHSGAVLATSLLAVAMAGGVFSIPMKAMIQSRASQESRARVLAGMNILSALAIFSASALVAVALHFGMPVPAIFQIVACSAVAALIGAVWAFPQDSLKGVMATLLKVWFRVEIKGAQHLENDGPVVFVGNHVSFADGPLLASLIGADAAIAVNSQWASGRAMRLASKVMNIYPLDPQSPMAAKHLAQTVRDGESALIFAEGRISTHGALMKVYPGTAWLVDQARAPVVTINIEGLEASIFTRKIPGLRRRLFPKVTVTVSAPQYLDIPEDMKGARRRSYATDLLQGALERDRMAAEMTAASIPDLYARARSKFDPAQIAICDPTGVSLSHKSFQRAAAAFSGLLQKETEVGERVGVLLPGVAGAGVVLMGLWRAGRVPAILNPTLGPKPMLSAIDTAKLNTVICSRAFVLKAKLEPVIAAIEEKGLRILWTEDLKTGITLRDKLLAISAARRPSDVSLQKDDPAVVLFTSGTEGAPKGVVLTHGNLVANIAQIRARTDISSRDRILSAMPLFHSLGLTAGLLLPLVSGSPLMIYPSPLHYRIVPEMAYAHQATMIFGTDTFLNGWARKASPYDFASVRAAIAGAEAVKPATRQLWSEKFGVRILEGYGATEAGPVIALNTPMENKAGTVGRILHGIDIDLTDVPGVDGKRLAVRGPNIMAGYIMPEDNGRITPVDNGWYDTGDIVTLDEERYVTIKGRAKRFAKVGGEMVSLAAAENLAAEIWPDARLAAVSLPDARKGEKVVLVTTQENATRKALSTHAKASGIAEITVPAEIVIVDAVPLLASGKVDYPGVMAQMSAA